MDSLHSIMPKHQKGKHLSFEQRVVIQTRIKDGFSLRAIALLLLSVMRLNVVLFCFIMVSKNAIRHNKVIKFTKYIVRIAVVNQIS